MKFSPVALAAAAVTGVYVSSWIGMERVLIVVCAALLVLAVYAFISKTLDVMLIIIIAVFGAAAFSYAYAVSDRLHALNDYGIRYAVLHGTVREPGKENSYDDNIKYTVDINAIEEDGETQKIRDRIVVTTPQKLSCGDEIILRGIVKDIPEQMNDDRSDIKTYYRSLGIFRKMYTDDITVTGKAPRWAYISGRIREGVDNAVYSCYSGEGAAVISAVLTGNYHHFSAEYGDAADMTAVKRMLHPAYLYTMLMVYAAGMFSGVINRRRRDAAVSALMLVCAFIGGGVGFVRCMLTGVFAFVIRRVFGAEHYPETVSWLVLAYVIAAPLMLYNAAFIMSVSAGVAVWAFMPTIGRYFAFLPKWIGRTLAVLLICMIFTLPVTAMYFDGICIYSPLLSVIMLPLVVTIIALAPLSIIMSMIFGAAPIVGAYVDIALWAVIRLTYFTAQLPFSLLVVPKPSSSVLLMFISAELGLYYYMKKYRSKAAVFAVAAAGFLVSASVSSFMQIGTAEFTFVNVGQGDGSLIRTKFRENIIIDGGGSSAFSEYDPGAEIFVPYLAAKGASSIDAAFVSHYHSDHVMGVIAAVRMLNVEDVFAPEPDESWGEDMLELVSELEEAAAESGTELHYINEDTVITFKSGLTLRLYPQNEIARFSDDENDTSMLIKAEYSGKSVLYTGDLTSFGEYAQLAGGTDVDSDILKVSHHGSGGSSGEEWIAAVSPEYAVISCGEDNVYGHPAKETLERLSGVTVLRTDMRGDITFRIGRDGNIKIKSLR